MDAEREVIDPDDPLGTVRAGPGLLAIRAHTADPDCGDLAWYIVPAGAAIPDDVEDLIASWPIVHQF